MSGSYPERFGRYTLLQQVAVGGMAELLLAIEDTPSEGRRFVTIKRIRKEYVGDPDYIDYFISEGRVSMRCNHPHLTKSFDLDTVEGVHYLAMEYIRGHTLLDFIRAAHKKKRPISVPSALRIMMEVAAALHHLHGMRDLDGNPMGVIHRDVTPQNIMLDATGFVKLIDFGIARSEVQVHKTQVGTVKGKLSYISPEQLGPSTNTKKRLDRRADIFALGIVMHESLTSRGLFRGKDDEDTLHRIRNMPIPIVSAQRDDVPMELDDLIQRSLEREVRHRFQNAKQVLTAIDALQVVAPAPMGVLRDELLALCGDPPIPTLGGGSFSVLKSALLGDDEEPSHASPNRSEAFTPEELVPPPLPPPLPEPPEEADLDYFLKRAGVNVKAAETRSLRLPKKKS